MQAKMLCLEEGARTRRFKDNTTKEVYEVSFRDVSETGVRCTDNFIVELDAEQIAKYKGKMRDQYFIVSIRSMRAFQGTFTINAEVEPYKPGK